MTLELSFQEVFFRSDYLKANQLIRKLFNRLKTEKLIVKCTHTQLLSFSKGLESKANIAGKCIYLYNKDDMHSFIIYHNNIWLLHQ